MEGVLLRPGLDRERLSHPTKETDQMRITRVSTAVIEANFDWTLVRIDTDEGVSGLGECFFAPGLSATVRDLSELLVGRDPLKLEGLLRKMELAVAPTAAGGAAHHAISGIETALWDINARALGVPLRRLFGGGFRDKVRVYADCHAGETLESYSPTLQRRRPFWSSEPLPGRDPDDEIYSPAAFAEHAIRAAKEGFTVLKFDIDLPLLPNEDYHARTISAGQLTRQREVAEAICDAVSPGVEVALDCHWRYSPADALRLARALEGLPILWLEDPVPPEDLDALRSVTARTSTPIASGENRYLMTGFTSLIEDGTVDIVSPDIQKVGGLSHARRIAALADAHYLPVAPHNVSSPVGTMASAHVCSSIPNFLALEWHASGVPFFDDMVASPEKPVIKDGFIELTDAPGLGIELDLDVCRRYAKHHEPFFDED